MKERIKQWIRYHTIKAWFEKYERVLIPGTLVLGVIFDWLTFISIDIVSSFILLGIYFVIAGATIAYLNAYDADLIPNQYGITRYLRLSAPLIIQFTFGALLSGSFIFYIFSGTVFVSWPFIALLVILMVSNDVFRHYYLRPVVQISVYFFILFSIVSIILPFAWNTISLSVFLVSGGVSLILIAAYVAFLAWKIPQIRDVRLSLAFSIAVIFVCVNGFYFLNLIPPIPLSIREATVAHDVKRAGGAYTLVVEEESWRQRLTPEQVFHKEAGERVFVYTAIFAPGKLSTTIVHHWQYYDDVKGEWVSRDRLAYAITGGKKTGYRGYSLKSNVEAGRWRVDVETTRGQVLGRVGFVVELAEEAPALQTVVK